MAIAKGILSKSLRGQVGKKYVYKQYGNKTVVTAYPNMKNIQPSAAQLKGRRLFAKASAFGRCVMKDPVKCAQFAAMAQPRQTPYHCAVSLFMRGLIADNQM
ncbi:hypothetical protein ACFOW1_14700 [Parasediminibacterium paludis]|uniref:Uncharacterized protein n=1 Tax=Parasediminibacterium paludis TaxID=908966 RepID=A0ABV8PZ47_9BACT